MKLWQTKNGTHIYQVLGGRSNSYLISTPKWNILVDTGKVSAYKKLRQRIDSLNLEHSKIDGIILTHTHYDHCQNAYVIKEHNKCRIWVGWKEAKYTVMGYSPMPNGTFGIAKIISKLSNLIGPLKFGFEPFIPDVFISADSYLMTDELNIKLILTEGHSIGSVSVIVDDEIAIVGDAMIGAFKDSIFPPFADDVNTMIKSWGRLLETDCEIFLPGHGKEITRELLQREFNKYSDENLITLVAI